MWIYFHWCDLDAPAVAIVWQILFARFAHVSVTWPAAVALGLAVWLIYAGDRILDIARTPELYATSRHAFHRRHRRAFVMAGIGAFSALLAVFPLLRPDVLMGGLTLAGWVALYLGAVHLLPAARRRWFPKELAVGVLFALGTCLAPWCRTAHASELIAPGIMFALLCCLNCALIEIWEWRDAGNEPRVHPHPCTLWLSRSLKPLVAAMSVICCLEIGRSLFAALLLSALCILVLDAAKNRLRADARRVLADAALLTPLLFLHG